MVAAATLTAALALDALDSTLPPPPPLKPPLPLVPFTWLRPPPPFSPSPQCGCPWYVVAAATLDAVPGVLDGLDMAAAHAPDVLAALDDFSSLLALYKASAIPVNVDQTLIEVIKLG